MRLYFHLTNGRIHVSDEHGVDVTDLESARRHIVDTIADLHRAPDIDPGEWNGWQLEVTTASGAVVFRISLSLN